ncbi:MAG: nitronate monooxygenase [Syntrophales bacterium]|nr:nitronate monooxygenase [Syntrophales bacterium]
MKNLLHLLGSKYPIIQGPIGNMNSPQMVAAVSEAGAYGMLALGFISDPEEARRLIREVKALTDKPFGANVVLLNPLVREILTVIAEEGIKTVTTSVGRPDQIYPFIHQLGLKGLHVVLSLTHAKKAEESGADGLVVVGAEAGGLRSRQPESSTMVLVPLVADNVSLPIVAAGGIADSRGYRAALALGAQGVQIGTRFLASTESIVPEKWKQMIVDCPDGGTTLIPVEKGMMTRVIITPWLKELLDQPGIDLEQAINYRDRIAAWERGDYDHALAGAGQVSALIKDIKPIRDIIEEMVS